MVAFNLNRYIWDSANGGVSGTLIDQDVWPTTKYDHRPIFPVNNLNAIDSSMVPYVLYDVRMEDMSGTLWPIYKECVTYTIVGEVPDIFYLRNYIFELMHKQDETAREINAYVRNDISIKSVRVYQKSNVFQFQEPVSKASNSAIALEVYVEYTKS